MGAPYSQDLRDRVLAAYDRGMKTKQIAHLFQVSPAWARRVKQRWRQTGRTTAKPMGGVTVVKIDLAKLAALVEQKPDATIKELHRMLGARCGTSAIGMALQRLGLTLKKRRSMPLSRTARMSRDGVPRGNASSRRSRPNG